MLTKKLMGHRPRFRKHKPKPKKDDDHDNV